MLCLTEKWLIHSCPSSNPQPKGFSIHRMDWIMSLGKKSSGRICLMVNSSWCSVIAVFSNSCSPHLEHLTVKYHPYILLKTDVCLSLVKVHSMVNRHQTVYPDVRDFNKASVTKSFPNYHQCVSCSTRGSMILDHCCSTIKRAYWPIPRPHFGRSDHLTVLLLPVSQQ